MNKKNENEFEDHLKKSISKIIKADVEITPRKKNFDYKKRKQFIIIIDTLFSIQHRNIMFTEMGINIDKYEDPFYDIIDNMLSFTFTVEQLALIYWWVYERVNPDGSINTLIDKFTNEEIEINSAELLYEYVLEIKNNAQ
jgi:hypothetical protein